MIDNVLGARAWCVPEKAMREVETISFYPKNGVWVSAHSDGGLDSGWAAHEREAVRFTLLRYAGISDDKGERLHEGDIIQWGYGDNSSEFTAKVVYVDYETRGDLDLGQRHVGFMIEFRSFGNYEHLRYSDLPTKGVGFKIIGNVYENPELWEESK